MDWNDMPEELLDSILSNLLGKDRYSFSLVCQSWNRVAKAAPYHYSPCLMMFDRGSDNFWRCFQHNGFLRMNFPTLLRNAVVRFSNHGWLLMTSSDEQTLFFFNPFNNQTIEVSPIPLGSRFTTIAFFHPPTSSDCVVIGIGSVTWNRPCQVQIGVLKYGEDEWNNIIFYGKSKFILSLSPPVLQDGKIYLLDVRGNVAVFDTSNWSLNVSRRCLEKRRLRRNIKEHFLIKPKGEETIYAVFVVHDERKVRVFKLTGELKWRLVEDLGEMVFYASNTSSFGYTTDSKSKSMANKIFFPKFYDDNVIFYSLETHKYHSFGGDYSSNNCYGFKKSDFATWMMPTTTRYPELAKELIWCPQVDEIAP